MKDLTKRNYFDITDGGFALLIFVLLQLIFTLVCSFIVPRAAYIAMVNNTFGYAFLSVVIESTFAIAAIIVASIKKVNFAPATTLNKKVNGKIVAWTLLLSVICLFAFTNITSAFMATIEKCGYTSPEYVSSDISTFWEYLLSIVTVCIVPAVTEEILFRGVVLNSLRPLGKWTAIFVSGISFMLMHGNPDQTIHQLLLGIMLAYMVWETRNIWVSILVHFFNNFLAITITYLSSAIASSNTLAESATEEAATAVTWTDIAYTYVLGAAIAALAIFFIIKIVARIKTQSEKVNGSPVTENLQLAVTIDGAATISNDGAMVSIGGGESENLPARDAAKDDNADEQIKVTKGAKLISAMCYALFAAYFLWEWISTFISRL